MSVPKTIIVTGNIVSPVSQNEFTIYGFLYVQNGIIKKIGSRADYEAFKRTLNFSNFTLIELRKDEFIIPGLIDCHVHAPQFPNIGLGLDRPLLEWLDKYTFPLEKQYGDEEFAANVYDQVVRRLLTNGTTTACYFGSLHLNGTLQLVDKVAKHKQRALIGKVSMNIENDAGYYNDTSTEITEVESFLQRVNNLKNELIQPIVTPRFAVSCNEQLLNELAKLAEKYNCMIQSHISENLGEVEYVKELNPNAKNYADVYDRSKILTSKCIMAHAVHLSEEEMRVLCEREVSVAHCPASNTRLRSGLCPLRAILDAGITVGLGTDVAGGDSASILDAIRRAMDVSTHLQLEGRKNAAISWKEAFYLATLGGAKALNLDNKIGSFEVGKEFDAIIVDVYKKPSQIDKYDYSIDKTEEEYVQSLLQRFLYCGDDRNISKVYVKGDEVKTNLLS